MALITCPECGKQVSDKAAKCPNCGCPSKLFFKNVCPECGIEVSKADIICQNCGYPLDIQKIESNAIDTNIRIDDELSSYSKTSRVTILGYTEPFATYPTIKVFCKGEQIGEVGHNERIQVCITENCVLEFKCSFRSTTCYVKEGDWVLLSFNRVTGALNATITDKDNYQFAINKNRGKDSQRWLWVIIIAILVFVLSRLI